MKKPAIIIMILIMGLVLTYGCGGGTVKAELGEQFTLKVGQEATITGEGLSITFDRVISDSRCPANVVCIQAGEARFEVTLTKGGTSQTLTLVEPGLSGPSGMSAFGYHVSGHLLPYPLDGVTTEPGDYYVQLEVFKAATSL